MRLINSNRFFLAGTNERFVHLGTATKSIREFMCFLDTFTSECYIEEITGGSLSYIEDDDLVTELHSFFEKNNITRLTK